MYVTGMDDKNAREWIFLLDAQRGVVAKAEAGQAGLSVKAIRHRLSSGRWKRVRRGVYATFTGPLPREARLWAAIRRAGPGAMLSHETAAEVHGMLDKPSAKIHVTVPHRRRPAPKRIIYGGMIYSADQTEKIHPRGDHSPVGPKPSAVSSALGPAAHPDRGHRSRPGRGRAWLR